MEIRTAAIKDFFQLYEIGQNTPELRVSAKEQFMDQDEFILAIENPNGIFLVAEEENTLVGFIYVNAKDKDKPIENRYACLVYLVVVEKFRRHGIAQRFYDECEKRLKNMGITHVRTRANVEGNGEIVEFMKKQGFAEGHQYVRMDKTI
ncbi:MAG: GNAT family N-acetyltransferase [Candidatus Absconditabacterales bacterium]